MNRMQKWWKKTVVNYAKKRGWIMQPQEIERTLKQDRETYDNYKEFLKWYKGDSTGLSNYYEQFKSGVRSQYFWSASQDANVKKTHSSLPLLLIDTLVNVTGIPEVGTEDEMLEERLHDLLEDNDFFNLLKQEQIPLTLVCGHGAFFPNVIDGEVSIEFVDARFLDFERTGTIITAVTKKTFYGDYVLRETRRKGQIEYLLLHENKVIGLDKLPETADINIISANQMAAQLEMMAVPVRFKAGIDTYGRSIFAGKLDLFDDFDQFWSQLSTLQRRYTPITYFPSDMIEIGRRGERLMPDKFGLEVVELRNPHGTGKVETITPTMMFGEFLTTGTEQLKMILAGTVSPSSVGIEFQRTPNAEAQREREKVTLVTRDDIIDNETGVIRKTLNLALRMQDVLAGKTPGDYDISVDFADYASPTFNDRVSTLLPLFQAMGISPDKFVEEIWAGALSDEELAEEIEKVKSRQVSEPYFDENI